MGSKNHHIIDEMKPQYYFNVKSVKIEASNSEEDLNPISRGPDKFKMIKEASTPFFLGSPTSQD